MPGKALAPKKAKAPARKTAKSAANTGPRARKVAPIALGQREGEVLLSDMAKRLEMTVQSCGVWCNRPGAPVRKEGKHVFVRAADFLRWREQQLIQEAVRRAMPSVSFDQARTRKALAEAERAEIEVAQLRRDVVAIEDYVAALDRVIVRIAARLRALPIRLAHLGDDVEFAAEVEIERVITELNRFDEDVLEDPDDEDETDDPAGHDQDDDED